jgi:hypothetical protein
VLNGTETFNNLTLNRHANGLFDYDWFTWTAGQSGTFTPTLNNINAFGGDLHERVYTLVGDNLVQLGCSQKVGGAKTQRTSVAVTAGEPLYTWVYGFDHALGTYSLTVSLT